MKPDTIKFPSQDGRIEGDLYSPPAGASPTGLVVIAYGSDGLVDSPNGPWETMIRGYATELAARGFFSLIPDYFAGMPPAQSVNAMVVKRDDWAAALLDSVTHARTLPRVDSKRIGLLGFSLGGYLCLRIRAAAKPRALVVHFAPMFPMFGGIGPAGQVPFVQIHHGKKDTLEFTPPTNADAIKAALLLENSTSDVERFLYDGAGHGFATKDKANMEATTLSKKRTLAFFTKTL